LASSCFSSWPRLTMSSFSRIWVGFCLALLGSSSYLLGSSPRLCFFSCVLGLRLAPWCDLTRLCVLSLQVVVALGLPHRLAAAALVDLLSNCVLGESSVSATSAFLSAPVWIWYTAC
jgi:hypothetical protein